METYDPHKSRKSSGILYKVAVAFVTATISGLLLCVFLIFQPQNFDGVGGLESPEGGRDLSAVLRESQQRQIPVTLTEAEINQWLARTLEMRQGGRFEDSVVLKSVVVRITDGLVEVVMEREIHGRRFTVSMFITIEQQRDGDRLRTEMNLHGRGYASWIANPPRGGRFGRLVVPQGFLRLVMPSFKSVAEILPDELSDGFRKMVYINFKDKQIELDPRMPRRDAKTAPR